MKLLNNDQTGFELTIAGYQFPEMETEEYDSNWLLIQKSIRPCCMVRAKCSLKSWWPS